jgi:hypothetical protein
MVPMRPPVRAAIPADLPIRKKNHPCLLNYRKTAALYSQSASARNLKNVISLYFTHRPVAVELPAEWHLYCSGLHISVEKDARYVQSRA